MKQTTVARLNDINRDFYDHGSGDFSATRQSSWHGWSRAFENVPNSSGKLLILDVGCGNGRLIDFLMKEKISYVYHGVDSSKALIKIASDNFENSDTSTFQRVNLMDFDWQINLPANAYDVICLFGVMHHMPSRDNRQRLLKTVRSLLYSGGLLMVSFWMFAEKKRFSDKIIDWTQAEPEIYEDLEQGDYLLPFGEKKRIRYCHFADKREQESIMMRLDMEMVDRYSADGKTKDLNDYWILQKLDSTNL